MAINYGPAQISKIDTQEITSLACYKSAIGARSMDVIYRSRPDSQLFYHTAYCNAY